MTTVETERLVIRRPTEGDRKRLVELFTDPAFTVFSDYAGSRVLDFTLTGMALRTAMPVNSS